jgi:hypothetical protein
LKVPRQCPLVLLVEVYLTQGEAFNFCITLEGLHRQILELEATSPERTKKKTPPLPSNGSSEQPKEQTAFQFFQKCKKSWNEQNHVGECGDDSYLSAAIRLTERQTKKKYIYKEYKRTWAIRQTPHLPSNGSSERTPKKKLPHCCAAAQQQEPSSNFFKNMSSLGTNKTTLRSAVMIPICPQPSDSHGDRQTKLCKEYKRTRTFRAVIKFFQSQSYFTTDDQSVSKSWFQGP